MSHITRIKTQLRDGQVLREVLTKMGYQVKHGKEVGNKYHSRRWSGLEMVAAMKSVKLRFQLSNAGEGCYDILVDWGVPKQEQEAILNQIYQAYAEKKVIKSARLRGFAVTRNVTNKNGQIEIVLRKVA